MRAGDDTRYDRIGFLLAGETAQAIGISSFGTGWYYIQLANGRRGYIAPSIVSFEGDVGGLPLVAPPPPPTPPATATPIATATPVTSANLAFVTIDLDPDMPICNQTITANVTIRNNGTTATASSGVIAVSDTHLGSGTVTESTIGGFPILQPGESFTGIIPITVTTFFNETHRMTFILDSQGTVPETNESDNATSVDYTLQQGSC